AVGRGLSGGVGEAGDPGGAVDPVVSTPDGGDRLPELAQGGLTGVVDALFGHQDADQPTVRLAEGVATDGVVVDAPLRLLAQPDLADQGARRRLPTGELDPGRLADHA